MYNENKNIRIDDIYIICCSFILIKKNKSINKYDS